MTPKKKTVLKGGLAVFSFDGEKQGLWFYNLRFLALSSRPIT